MHVAPEDWPEVIPCASQYQGPRVVVAHAPGRLVFLLSGQARGRVGSARYHGSLDTNSRGTPGTVHIVAGLHRAIPGTMSVFAAVKAEVVFEASFLLSWSERLESSGQARIELHRLWPVVANCEGGARWSAYSDSVSG